ncbi:MAG: hypothetical protein OEZ36_12475 [Spirochaetota bacterium]|nr:hypothetical protein [Spirochaetota bacterium]
MPGKAIPNKYKNLPTGFYSLRNYYYIITKRYKKVYDLSEIFRPDSVWNKIDHDNSIYHCYNISRISGETRC